MDTTYVSDFRPPRGAAVYGAAVTRMTPPETALPGSDLSPEEFRSTAHALVDWIADYAAGIRDRPVLPDTRPGELLEALPASGPEQGETMQAILGDFEREIVPRLTHWRHPHFLAFFPSAGSFPGVLAELLAAATNANALLWQTAPASTELEMRSTSWLREWMGLGAGWFGILFDTASTSTLHGLACAREHVDPEAHRRGGDGRLVVYISDQSHSSVAKAAIALGYGQDNVRVVPSDDEFRMQPRALREMIESDRAAGRVPCCVVPTVGTTSTTSVDPVADIVPIAREHGMWVHVDAAYGGALAIVPELRDVFDGVEQADSLVVNPHKWLAVPMDCSAFYTRRPEVLRRAFSLTPDYLRTYGASEEVNLMDYGIPLGRRFRSLKLWFVLRHFGREGLIAMLRSHLALTRRIAGEIAGDERFEMAAPVRMAVVNFRFRGSDADNQRIWRAVNARRDYYISQTTLRGRFVLRFRRRHAGSDVGGRAGRVAGGAGGGGCAGVNVQVSRVARATAPRPAVTNARPVRGPRCRA